MNSNNYSTFNQIKSLKQEHTAILLRCDWELFASLNIKSQRPETAIKALKRLRNQMAIRENSQVGCISLFSKIPSPHVHALFIGYSTKTNKSLKDLNSEQLSFYERLWPGDAKILKIGNTSNDLSRVCNYFVKNMSINPNSRYPDAVEPLPDMGLRILNKTMRNKK